MGFIIDFGNGVLWGLNYVFLVIVWIVIDSLEVGLFYLYDVNRYFYVYINLI